MVKKAVSENDIVILIVSLKDRDNIFGVSMAKVWKHCIINALPKDVKPVFLMGSPIKHVFSILGDAERSMILNRYRIYGDEYDIENNFKKENLQKYYPNLWDNGQINLMPSKRKDVADISGTRMREFLANNDFESFRKYIPPELDAEQIFLICLEKG